LSYLKDDGTFISESLAGLALDPNESIPMSESGWGEATVGEESAEIEIPDSHSSGNEPSMTETSSPAPSTNLPLATPELSHSMLSASDDCPPSTPIFGEDVGEQREEEEEDEDKTDDEMEIDDYDDDDDDDDDDESEKSAGGL
jgi:hypothetical protein